MTLSIAGMKVLVITRIGRLEPPGGEDGLMVLLHLLLVDHSMIEAIEDELQARLEGLLLEDSHHLGPHGNVRKGQGYLQALPVFLHQDSVLVLLDVARLGEVLAGFADGKGATSSATGAAFAFFFALACLASEFFSALSNHSSGLRRP